MSYLNQRSEQNHDADLSGPITKCEVDIMFGYPCPQKVTKILVTKHAKGFCPVCEFHADNFELKSQVNIIPLAKFEQDREKYLYPNLATE